MLRQTPLSLVGLLAGGSLTVLGIIAYATDNATLNLAGFFYGIPLLLGGLALKAAELPPIPFSQPTSEAILQLRQQQATPSQNQIRQDVTRYRYGEAAHLADAIERLGLAPNDRARPTLTGIKETAINGNYALILEFDSPFVPLDAWQQKQEKMTSFFGPNVLAAATQPAADKIEVALIAQPI